MEKSGQKPQEQKDAAGQQKPAECVEKKRTWGNIIYDFGIFGSIAWVGVAVLSAVSAHQAQYGKNKAFDWLRTLNDKAYKVIHKGASKLLKGHPQDVIDGYAKGTTMFLTLGMGGNALAGVLKWGEDNRQSNAAVIDNLLGTTPPDPETIKAEPKQTWKSVLTGRLASYGASYAAFLAMGPRLTDKIGKAFGNVATNAWMKISPRSDVKNVRRWSDIAAFDATFTAITALLTYGLSRYVAGHDAEKKEEVLAHQAPAAEAAPAEEHEHKTSHASRFTSNRDKDGHTRFAHNARVAAEIQPQMAL